MHGASARHFQYPRPCANQAHPSVLAHEMLVIEPGEIPSRMLTWKLGFLSHIKRRLHDDHIQLPLWETWFCSRLDIPLPVLVVTPQFCSCKTFHFDAYDDHLQTCQSQSASQNVHDCVVYKHPRPIFATAGHV
jgi:hypothetical protein